jgi:hypothetical protein
MELHRKVIVIRRPDDSLEVLSHFLADNELDIQKHYKTACQHYLGVDILIADCIITPQERQFKPNPTAKRVAKPRASKPPEQSMLPNVSAWDLWMTIYKEVHGRDYLTATYGKDVNILKRLHVAVGLDMKRLETVFRNYFGDDDEWLPSNGFPIGVLASRINKYADPNYENQSNVCMDPTSPDFDIMKVKVGNVVW